MRNARPIAFASALTHGGAGPYLRHTGEFIRSSDFKISCTIFFVDSNGTEYRERENVEFAGPSVPKRPYFMYLRDANTGLLSMNSQINIRHLGINLR